MKVSPAVHSFIGDTVEVSWNAASRAPSAAGKAARFLLELQAATARAPAQQDAVVASIDVSGAAIACRARVQMAGSTAKGGQQALLCALDGASAAEFTALAVAAARVKGMLCTDAVAEDACGTVESCPIGFLHAEPSTPVATPPSARRVHALLRQVVPDDMADEWLYVLNRYPESPADNADISEGEGAARPADPATLPLHLRVRHAFDTAVVRHDWRGAYAAMAALASDERTPRVVRPFVDALREGSTELPSQALRRLAVAV
uniref:Uncharacterized protein n=1 Tax=Neobodo designis TaxID=312471 RepID=A0A7S1PZ35_NEODS|mmetsp:Transcript_26954/g.83440  ORF Transcript_26954/g.83440 Transcript_26954/m.83440 type:complete len:262 (+) Transcript_26954:85-870(+)